MKNILYLFALSISFSSFSQPLDKVEQLQYPYISDSIFSTILDEYKDIRIQLPKERSSAETYPVIYVLDAEWMFEPTALETKILTDFDVIPKSIVVGIFHEDRNKDLGIRWQDGTMEISSINFKQFLIDELVPYVNSKYSTSGFNTLIGHSNSATFSQKILAEKDQPFQGFISLSQNLFGNQFQEIADYLSTPSENHMFYFVASGTRDATPRLESGFWLDSLFQHYPNDKILTKHQLYDADHTGVVAKGLNNGISHIFSKYTHQNDWNEELIDSLLVNDIGPIAFIKRHSGEIKEIYGIAFKANQDDLSLMQSLAETDAEIKEVQEYELKYFGRGDHFYASYAQYYEYIESYENAFNYWGKNLKGDYSHNENFFYYRRPIELLNKKMNQPERAIAFAQSQTQLAPVHTVSLNFMIASIAFEYDISKDLGMEAIQQCIANYQSNKLYTLEEAKKIQKLLSK